MQTNQTNIQSTIVSTPVSYKRKLVEENEDDLFISQSSPDLLNASSSKSNNKIEPNGKGDPTNKIRVKDVSET